MIVFDLYYACHENINKNTALPVLVREMATQSCLPIAECCSFQLCVTL